MKFGSRGSAAVIVAIVVLGVVCAAAGVAVFVFKIGPGGHGAHAKAQTSLVPVGELVVNLADTGEIHYLKTDIVLEVRGQVSESEQDGAKARVRDAIIDVLCSKKLSDLIKPDGKLVAKKQIIQSVNARLDGIHAVGVLFNEFAMQ